MDAVNAESIDARSVSLPLAAAIEAAEAHAWADLYAAAPRKFADEVGLTSHQVGGALVLCWAGSGRRYFSRVIGLGVTVPAREEVVDEILSGYREAGVTMFLFQSLPHCRPAGYEGWLRGRGLEAFDVQDRVVRGGRHVAPNVAAPEHGRFRVERVDSVTKDEWADFLQHVYRLETGSWLQALIGRHGWHQYVARERGEIVAARGMHIGRDGTAWLGMDGPVPGLMTKDYEPDAALCALIVEDGLALRANAFIADIEAPSAEMDTPAYEYFHRLGFRRPYARTHFATL